MLSFLAFNTATCRRVQPRGRMEERKGGRAPLGVKDTSRDGAALGGATREIKTRFYARTAGRRTRETTAEDMSLSQLNGQ